jgi:phosphatidylinositol glycan class H protein
MKRGGVGEKKEIKQHPRYEYVCDLQPENGFPLLHTHRIIVRQRGLGSRIKWCLFLAVCFLSAPFFWSIFKKGEGLHWLLVAVGLIYFLRQRCGVQQEAVVVMPTLGIQLETVYHSKNVKRRFVPLHRILWPVINEAVTPTTCYTYLALLLRDDSRLTLTFLHVRPPLSMLVPIWTALCSAVGHPPRSLLRSAPNSSAV